MSIVALPHPFTSAAGAVPVADLAEPRQVDRTVCGVRPIEVPLIVLTGDRRRTLYAPTPGLDAHFRAVPPLTALGTLASTTTGFLAERAPDFHLPGAVASVGDVARAAGAVYRRDDAHGFRVWLGEQVRALPGLDTALSDDAATEALMVALIYLNHMWRQGDATEEPATGPSALPAPLDRLLDDAAAALGTLPRFNQIVMTMLAFELDGTSGPLTHTDVVAVDRMRPAFWLSPGNQSELDLYRAFYAVEALGVPLYGWGCHALECATADDREGGARALRMVHAVIRNVYMITKRLIPRIDADEFRRIQVTCGWVGDELTGVASGYQLPFMLMLDALFHVNFSHTGVIAARANNLRFVPEDWKAFFRVIYDHQPALKTWATESGDAGLLDAYRSCVDVFTLFRSMHRHLGGQAIKGGTTTGRVFESAQQNYAQFMDEMEGLVADTAATGDLSAPVSPDGPAAAASRGAAS